MLFVQKGHIKLIKSDSKDFFLTITSLYLAILTFLSELRVYICKL